jgi:peroxiredoxin
MQAPSQLPTPIDDGACEHLPGIEMPSLLLPSTAGRLIDLSKRDAARTVVYCYSMTGVPGAPLPEGWDLIPGARGCTPQACAFRDHYQELATFEAELFGLGTQTTAYQREMAVVGCSPLPKWPTACICPSKSLVMPSSPLRTL